MSYQPGNQGDIWDGIEPPRSEPSGDGGGGGRTLIVLLSAAIVLLLAIACAVGAVWLWRQSQSDAALTPTLDVPPATVVVQPPGGDPGVIPTTAPGVSTPTIAPAATATTVAVPPTVTSGPPAGALVVGRVAAPTIDGLLGDWSGLPLTTSQYRVYSVGGWDGSDDVVAAWRLGWDESALYVAVDVTDNIHVQTESGNQIFRGDSLDMQIDTDPGARATRVNPRTLQIIFSPGDFAGLPPSYFRFQGTAGGQVADAQVTTIQVAARKTATGYTLEAAIPWSALNVTPAPGLTLGLALNANDNDTPGSAVQEVMMSPRSDAHLPGPDQLGGNGFGGFVTRPPADCDALPRRFRRGKACLARLPAVPPPCPVPRPHPSCHRPVVAPARGGGWDAGDVLATTGQGTPCPCDMDGGGGYVRGRLIDRGCAMVDGAPPPIPTRPHGV